MTLLEDYVIMLENLGVLDVLLPFLLIFTIAFAVLQKSKILGREAHRFNVIISLVLSLAAVIPHVIGRGPDVVTIINNALPSVSLLMIGSMMALLLIGVFGHDVYVAGTPLAGIAVLFSILAVAYAFLSSAGVLGKVPFLVDPQTRSLLVAILVFGLIVFFITAEPRHEREGEGFMDMMEGFGRVLGGRPGGGHR